MTTDTPSLVTNATTASDAHPHQHSPFEYNDRERLANLVARVGTDGTPSVKRLLRARKRGNDGC